MINGKVTVNLQQQILQPITIKHYNREPIYMIKDIIAKLCEYGELNQTALASFCGLNMTKHIRLLDYLEAKNLVSRKRVLVGNRFVILYKATPKAIEFYKSILEPYEEMIPRAKDCPWKVVVKV